MSQQKLPTPCHHAAMLQFAPPWFQRVGSTVKKKGTKDVNVNFAVACSGCKKKQQTISVGSSNGLAKATLIGDAIKRAHDQCQVITPSCTAPQDPFLASTAEIERLEKELGQQRRQMDEFQRENGQLKRTAEQARLNKQQQSTAQRLKTGKDNKAQPIVRDNQTPFGKGVRSSKMLGTRGVGIVKVMEDHCEGSEAKLLDVVCDLIRRYNLEDAVAAHLGASTESTAQYIVKRARAALAELKHCRSESQRQQYRLVLTVLAPEFGMAASVALALDVGRKCKPLLDSIALRDEIDTKIEASKKRLEVGDEVLCRHGKGALVEVDSDYDNEDEDCAHPCAVEIEVDGHKQVSKFKRSGRGKGGARLHRIPISFAHGPRKVREDATSANVKQKVCHCWSVSHCFELQTVESSSCMQCR